MAIVEEIVRTHPKEIISFAVTQIAVKFLGNKFESNCNEVHWEQKFDLSLSFLC